MLQDSARHGAMLLPGIGLTSASWVADRTMNGVPWMLSAGSNHVGTSVVWTAHVICPSGPAPAGTAATRVVRATNNDARSLMTDLLRILAGEYVRARGKVNAAARGASRLDTR